MKLAFFVEGYTELRLIKELAIVQYGIDNLSFNGYKLRGGNTIPIKASIIDIHKSINQEPLHIFNVFECGGHSNMRSMVEHQRNSLYTQGFDEIISLRDVHPCKREDIFELKRTIAFRMAQKPIKTIFLLCIMETEAWFIAEHQHFLKISPNLTTDYIKNNTGIDLMTFDVESLDTPSDTLNAIYTLEGETYNKQTPGHIDRTIDALDLDSLILDLAGKIPSLGELISIIDRE